MPGWHAITKEFARDGRLRVAGIIQEQHPDRARLFMQWQQMNWPLMVDSLDLLEVAAVPITLFIDEYGIVRAINPRRAELRPFLDQHFSPPAPAPPAPPPVPGDQRLDQPPQRNRAESWHQHGNDLVLWGGAARLNQAIAAYTKAEQLAPQDGWIQFRLGVAYRMRFDSAARRPGDFARAAEHWSQALAINPNQYIWRRRIQQYGPRLQKPYSFYDWVTKARREIRARGAAPIALAVEPSGAEFARPQKTFAAATSQNPDPEARIHRDTEGFIEVETAVVPARVKPGETVRVHVILRPSAPRSAHWNNEAEPLTLWIDLPSGWEADAQQLTLPNPPTAVSREARRLEFELRTSAGAERREYTVQAFALYNVCEDVNGVCLYRRQDIPLKIRLDR